MKGVMVTEMAPDIRVEAVTRCDIMTSCSWQHDNMTTWQLNLMQEWCQLLWAHRAWWWPPPGLEAFWRPSLTLSGQLWGCWSGPSWSVADRISPSRKKISDTDGVIVEVWRWSGAPWWECWTGQQNKLSQQNKLKIFSHFTFRAPPSALGLPEAMAGPTPFKLESAETAASISFLLSIALNAFLVSCMTTRGVFICIKSFNLGRKTPL